MRKKKRLVFLGFLFVCCLAYFQMAFANFDSTQKLRVGLEYKYKNVNSVPITNTSVAIGCDTGNGFQKEARFESAGGFIMITEKGFYAVVQNQINNFDDAYHSANTYKADGHHAVPAFLGQKNWRVYLGPYDSKEAASQAMPGTAVVEGNSKLALLCDGVQLVVFDSDSVNPQIAPLNEDKITTLGDRSYRGVIEFGRYNGGAITAVNVVSMDEYLYGVVPSEMPPSYHEEALKAQAVAARTYAAYRINTSTHLKQGYNLCDNVNCQVYKGFDVEKPSTNLAVEATSGKLVYYEGLPINAVFFSSSGGATDNAENVWASEIPYLQAVPEPNELDATQWTKTFTLADLDKLMRIKGVSIGSVQDILITDIGASGRINELQIVGSEGNKTVSKEEIRSYFSPIDANFLSRMFQINAKGSNVSTVQGKMPMPIIPQVPAPSVEKESALETSLPAKEPINTITPEPVPKGERNNTITLSDDLFISDNGLSEQDLPLQRAAVSKEDQKEAGAGHTVFLIQNNSTPVPVSTVDASGTFVVTGAGNGHGVGMSQKGANGMAQIGFDFMSILKHYYTGVTVE